MSDCDQCDKLAQEAKAMRQREMLMRHGGASLNNPDCDICSIGRWAEQSGEHDPRCCSERGCHPETCSHGVVQEDGSLLCGTWRSLPDADLAERHRNARKGSSTT